MSTLWTLLRWFISAILFVDGCLLIWTTVRFVRDLKLHPEEYKKCGSGRLSDNQVASIFAGGGLFCLALLYITLPL